VNHGIREAYTTRSGSISIENCQNRGNSMDMRRKSADGSGNRCPTRVNKAGWIEKEWQVGQSGRIEGISWG